jgi:hypothetical protein
LLFFCFLLSFDGHEKMNTGSFLGRLFIEFQQSRPSAARVFQRSCGTGHHGQPDNRLMNVQQRVVNGPGSTKLETDAHQQTRHGRGNRRQKWPFSALIHPPLCSFD